MMPDYIFVLAILQIIWIDVVLSGDNAVVIAMACRSLPPRQRRIGIAFGVVLALALRLAMAGAVSYLLAVPFLKIIGGLLLLWIAVKVIRGEEDGGDARRAATTLLPAIGMIVVADATMSLDNVVAIAAAARGDALVFGIGLALSMPLMIVGASLITSVINRFPIIVWAGGGLLGWIAGGMIISDPYVAGLVHLHVPDAVVLAHYSATCAGVVGVVAAALLLMRFTRSHAAVKQIL